MIRLLLLLAVITIVPNIAHAACPAAPVGSNQDRVIQMVAGGDGVTQMAREGVTDATEEGAIVYDATNKTLAVCDGTNWIALGAASTDCSIPGQICSDGAVFVGMTPNGSDKLFAAPCDVGKTWGGSSCTGSRTLLAVKTSATETLGADKMRDGVANTDAMALEGLSVHPAAQECRSLGPEWYLPSFLELRTLYANANAGALAGTYDYTGYYWSSTGVAASSACAMLFTDGSEYCGGLFKTSNRAIRCVRN